MLKMNLKYILPPLIVAALVLFIAHREAYSDVGGGGSSVNAVASMTHSVGEVESLFNRFNESINEYNKKNLECSKILDAKEKGKCLSVAKALLEEAKTILVKLNDLASRVESEIGISKKKIDEVFSSKLDRLLNHLAIMRQGANKVMKSSAGSI